VNDHGQRFLDLRAPSHADEQEKEGGSADRVVAVGCETGLQQREGRRLLTAAEPKV